VIVASILVAFAIDAWWDLRRDLQAEQVLLTALEQDMLRNRREVARVLSALDWYSSSTLVFFEADPEALRQLDPDSAQALRVFTRVSTFDASDGALRNQDLSVLRDDQLLNALGEWSRAVANLQDGGPLMMEQSSLAAIRGAELAPDFFLSPDAESPADLGRLRSDPEFVAILISVHSRRNLHRILVSGLDERADSIIEAIRRQRR
jgi:hypothetical protein